MICIVKLSELLIGTRIRMDLHRFKNVFLLYKYRTEYIREICVNQCPLRS